MFIVFRETRIRKTRIRGLSGPPSSWLLGEANVVPALEAGGRHTITHHRLDVSVYEGSIKQDGYTWKDIESVPITSLTRKIHGVVNTKAERAQRKAAL